MSAVDAIIVLTVLAALLGLGVTGGVNTQTTEDYFLAGRGLRWWQIGFSLFATNFSAAAIIGLTGAAYLTGIAIYNYEWVGILAMVFFALVLVRSVRNSRVFTIAGYLEERYDERVKVAYSVFILFLLVFIDMAGALYAGGVLINEFFPGVSINLIIFAIMVLAGTYSILGGLRAISRIDAAQSLVLIVGAVLVSIYTVQAAGGLGEVLADTSDETLSLVRPLGDRAVPWTGLVMGVPVLCAYFWLTNQNMAQWVLSAKSERDARNGLIMAGFLKTLVLFIIIIPGVAAAKLFPGLSEPDRIYPTLLFELLPVGVLGLVFAGFVTAIMSSADSILHAVSTIITMDFIKKFRSDFSAERLVGFGRITTGAIIVVSAIWAPMIGRFGTLFEYIQGLLSYAVAPFVVVYLAGWFWPRANARGALAALAMGLGGACVAGILRQAGMLDIHYLNVPLPLAVLSLAGLVLGSLTAPRRILAPHLTFTGLPEIGRGDLAVSMTLLALVALQVAIFW